MSEVVFRSKQLHYGTLEFAAYMYSEEGCRIIGLRPGTVDYVLRYKWNNGSSASTDPGLSRCVPEEQYDRWFESVSSESEFFRLKEKTDAIAGEHFYTTQKQCPDYQNQ